MKTPNQIPGVNRTDGLTKIKKVLIVTLLFSNALLSTAQTQVTINGATSGAATLYLNSGANLNVQGSINIVSSGGGTNNYLQNNGTIQLLPEGTSGQSNISNNVTGLTTYTSGQTTGTVTFAADTQTQTLSGSGTAEFMNVTTNSSLSPTLNLQQNMTADGALTIGGATAEINSTTLTLNGTLSATGTLTGSASSNLTINGSGNLGSALTFASGAQTLHNLNLNRTNASGQTIALGSALSVAGALTINNGILNLQDNNLSLSSTALLSGSPFSTGNMIQADGAGQFIRGIGVVNSSASFIFPVGDGSPNYTPVNLNFSSNNAAGTVGVKVTNSTESNNDNPAAPYVYLTRYWTFSNSLGNYSYTGSFTYPAGNLSNPSLESSLKLSQWTGSSWSEFPGSSAAAGVLTETSTLTQAAAPLTGDFTGRKQCTNPSVFNVTGGINCGSSTVGLSNSETGVNYQLLLNDTGTGILVPGTGSPLTFGSQSAAGAYKVIASSEYGGCTSNMNDSSVVHANPTAYAVTGGACVPATMGLNGSDIGISYQLVRNGSINEGSPVAGTGDTISFPAESNAGTYTVFATNTTTGCTATMTGVSTVNICTSTWVGTTTNWFADTAWSPAAVPNNCSANVIIPSGLQHYPIISGASVSVGNVNMADGSTITLMGQNLNVCGNWTGGSGANALVTTVDSGAVYLNGSSADTIDGNTQFSILQIDNANGVMIESTSAVSITTGLQLKQGVVKVGTGTLHLLSTSSNTNSYIDDFTSGFTGSINGTIEADRYVPIIGSNQHFFSSPVNTPPFSQLGASGPNGSYVVPLLSCDEYQSYFYSPYGTVFEYVDGHQPSGQCMLGNWEIRSQGTLDNGRGYSTYLTGDSTITLSGTANTGNISVGNLNNSGYPSVATLQGHPIESGWNLVGNPYPSAINLSISRDTAGFQNQVLLWVASGPFNGSWQYAVIDSPAESTITVAPFQAFMVRVKPNSTGLHSYPFFQSERTRTANASFYRVQNENTLNLELDYNGTKDMTTVTFKPGATNTFDDEMDANKPDGVQGRPTLYTTMGDDHWYGLNNLPPLTQISTVPMGLHPEVSGTMTVTPSGIESFDPTSYIYLEDKQTSTWQNLRDGAYTFTANATDNQSRFVLHFTPPAEILTGDASCSSPGLINITQPGSASWNYIVTDANNNTIASGTLNQSNPVTVSANAGIYVLTLKDNNGYTVMKNVQIGGSSAITAEFASSVTSATTDDNISFNSSTANATGYNWNFGDGSTASGQSVTHDYTSEGTYTVQLAVTNAAGCTSSTTRIITITPRSTTGVTSITDNGRINIWSNENRIFVDFTKQANADAQVDIYNVIGQLLSSEKYGKSSLYSKEIDNLEAAYLIVRVKNGDGITTKKVFIANVK